MKIKRKEKTMNRAVDIRGHIMMTFTFLLLPLYTSYCFFPILSNGFVLSPSKQSVMHHHHYNINYYRYRKTFASPCFGHPHDADETSDIPVVVYDNVFHSYACEELHYLAQEHSERSFEGASVFLRPPHNERPLTPIEHAIDSVLLEMGDTTKLVEYWSRDEYMNIDAHADIDETMLEDESVVRCPLVGHVLYLQIKNGLRGPTCIFPNERKGWALRSESMETELVIVPAVEGRVLRFPGDAMHAVPKPYHRWLSNAKNSYFDHHDDDEEEEDCSEDEEVERSVLLFNTWSNNETGPIGVTGDIAAGALPDGIEISEEDQEELYALQEAEVFAEWEEEYGNNGESIRCNPFSEWSVININHDNTFVDSNENGRIKVPLMGMEERRLHPDQEIILNGPIDEIESALERNSTVSALILTTI